MEKYDLLEGGMKMEEEEDRYYLISQLPVNPISYTYFPTNQSSSVSSWKMNSNEWR